MVGFFGHMICLHFGCDNPKSIYSVPISDDFYERCRLLVLSENQPGKTYFFSGNSSEIDEISITYLGTIITRERDTLKIVNSVSFSGLLADSRRGSGNVFLYGSLNKRIGFYYVGSAKKVPSKLGEGTLVFDHSGEGCDKSTIVSLRDSIPKYIFINCTEEGGDLYSFTNEY
jgi:hypothetical protein